MVEASYRKYSKEFRETALRRLSATANVSELCRELGISRQLLIHVWSMLQPQNWTGLSWHRSSAKAGATHLRGDTRNDRTEYNLVGSSDNSDEAQSHNVRLGELLLSWAGQYSLSCCRWLRDDEAASVVANET